MQNKLYGKYGENQAEKFLIDKKYKILYRNFTCKLGEIDLIAKQENYIIFIEVKTRNSINNGHPEESVTSYKQKQLAKTAMFYINKYNLYNYDFRFDVIAILIQDKDFKIKHIENAFEVN